MIIQWHNKKTFKSWQSLQLPFKLLQLKQDLGALCVCASRARTPYGKELETNGVLKPP